MPVHRLDRLLQWLFAKLALPFLTLCLLSTTSKSLQPFDTGLLDKLHNLHSLTRLNQVLWPEKSDYYRCLWEIRKLYMPITMWLGIFLSAAHRAFCNSLTMCSAL